MKTAYGQKTIIGLCCTKVNVGDLGGVLFQDSPPSIYKVYHIQFIAPIHPPWSRMKTTKENLYMTQKLEHGGDISYLSDLSSTCKEWIINFGHLL